MTVANRGDSPPVVLVSLNPPGFADRQEDLDAINDQLRKRLKSFSYTEELEKSPELTLVLENEDLYWIDEQGGADAVIEGTFVEFQFGYLDPIDPTRDKLSLPRVQTIIGKPNIARNQITITAASKLQTVLGGVILPQWFEPQKVSDLVRKILKKAGFDANHRLIQDTGFIDSGLGVVNRETYLSFIYRLARPYNYRFYITPGADGLPIAHFHKPGYTRKEGLRSREISALTGGLAAQRLPDPDQPARSEIDTLGEGLAAQRDLVVIDQELGEDGFAVAGNGNFATTKGVIRYRPNPTQDSNVLDWSISFEPDGTPASAQSTGTDVDEGKPLKSKTTTEDKDEKSLADRSPHAKAEGRTTFLANATPEELFESAKVANDDEAYQEFVDRVLERVRLEELARQERIGSLGAGLAAQRLAEQEKPVTLLDDPLETEILFGQKDVPSGIAGVSNTAYAAYIDTSNKKAQEHTKAYLEKAQSQICKLELTLRGIPNMDAGDIWLVEGLKIYSQRYLIQKVTHAFSPGSGYKTTTSCSSDGVNSKQFAETGRAKTKEEIDLELGVSDVGDFFKTSSYQLVRSDGTTVKDVSGSTDTKLPDE